jgi:hypothetical protein
MEPLLDEVLTGAEVGALRAASLELSIELARRRRRSRVRNRVLAAVMVPLLVLTGGILWPRRPVAPANPRSFSIVHTGPLQPGMRMPPQPIQAGYRVVTTDPANAGYRILSDEALLALFPNRPVGLISDRDGQRHLVFLDGGGVMSPGE